MNKKNDMTMSFDTGDLVDALSAQDEHVLDDQSGLEQEDVAIKETIDIALANFGLKDAKGFIYEDINGTQIYVKIACPSHVKIGNKICVNLFVQESAENSYVMALGSDNDNWFSNITIEKSDIVRIFSDKKASLKKLVNMATMIKDAILPSLEIGDKFITKKEDAARELGMKTPNGKMVFIRSVGDGEPKQENPVSLEVLKTKAFAIKQVLRQTGDLDDNGEPVYEVMDFNV